MPENDYQVSLSILESYLNHEYSLEYFKKICKHYLTDNVLHDYSYVQLNFGTETKDVLQKHREHMRRYYMEKKFHRCGQLSLQLTTLLKNDLDFKQQLSNSQIMSLRILRTCYIYQGNLSQVSSVLHLPIATILTYLSAPFLSQVLSSEANLFLEQILMNAYLFDSAQIYQRKEMLSYLFDVFILTHGNLELTSQLTNFSSSLLRFFLENPQNIFLTGHQKDQEWILLQLKNQQEEKDIVENQVLMNRKKTADITNEFSIGEEKIRKLVKEQIPLENPVRGVLIRGVLSTLE